MATLMRENGADIRFIQAMLGHADLKSTQIYTHVAVKQMKAIHEATHPAKARKAKPAAGAAAPTADHLLAAPEVESAAEGDLQAPLECVQAQRAGCPRRRTGERLK